MSRWTTLRAGGPAEWFLVVRSADEFANALIGAFDQGIDAIPVGWGSNMLVSDLGLSGLTILNLACQIVFGTEGEVIVDTGIGFQNLFIACAQRNLGGLEFAVGIPGTLGGALVSNAGAYRSNVSEFIEELEVVDHGERKWVKPEFMGFRYRDSILRQETRLPISVLRVKMRLPTKPGKDIYDEARDYQRQRISKQPASASAGSYFKNVYDRELAEQLPQLRGDLKAAGVVPAGVLIEAVGLKGARFRGGMLGARHANFLLNVGGANATDLRHLTEFAQKRVRDAFDVELEPEVLFLGDWSQFESVESIDLE
ncbi:MAG: UDP-N-acetylmuramate dehydrogenase [Fimbriimonadaceae bacterium]|nr:UDP-N-acetylmuramate dehydrogenase [Fimbriimonadaceae bacterium]